MEAGAFVVSVLEFITGGGGLFVGGGVTVAEASGLGVVIVAAGAGFFFFLTGAGVVSVDSPVRAGLSMEPFGVAAAKGSGAIQARIGRILRHSL